MSLTNRYANIVLVLLVGATAQAATTNTTLTVTATAPITGTTLTATGTATLTNIGNGMFSATLSLTSITGTNLIAPFTITLTPSGDQLTGTITLPAALLSGTSTSATGSVTVTGGTGSFAGATGSFPAVTGSGSIGLSGIALTFSGAGSITTGGSTGPPPPPTPTITLVADAAAYSSNIAQGSIFVVKGTNLSAAGLNQFSFPLPTTSGGVTITFTPVSGGTGTPAYLIYTFNQSGVNQLAGILPSNVAVGNYNVTVTNNGAVSAPFPTAVVQRKIELLTQDTSGSGLALVQNFISAAQLDVDRFTTGTASGYTISPAKPGQVLIAWGTGMGPVAGGDNVASPGFDFSANGVNVQVIVGGVSITPVYAGRAPGLAGADQINFTLPSNVPTGCAVPFQVSVGGVLSAPTFISIAPSTSATACVSPAFTTAQLQNFDQGGTYTTGGFSISQISETLASLGTGTVKIDLASGGFTEYTGFQLGAISTLQAQSSPSGACQIIQVSGTGTQGQLVTGHGTNLDAGVVTLNGPSGSNISNLPITETNNAYSLTIGEEGLPPGIPGLGGNGTIVAGTYTLSGAGGKDVGKFNASLTLGTPLTIAGGLPSAVTRTAGLTLNWTGGNSTDLVEIVGLSGTSSGTGANATVTATEFVCTTTAGAGTFTVPASILSQLPATTAAAIASGAASSLLEVATSVLPANGNGTFSAPLTAGGSISATFLGLLGIAGTPAYQ